MGRKVTCCGGLLAVLGIALVAVGVALKWSIFPKVLENQVYENVKLEKGTEGYDAFVSFAKFLYLNVYWILKVS